MPYILTYLQPHIYTGDSKASFEEENYKFEAEDDEAAKKIAEKFLNKNILTFKRKSYFRQGIQLSKVKRFFGKLEKIMEKNDFPDWGENNGIKEAI